MAFALSEGKWGHGPTRIAANTFTTSGLIFLCLYERSGYYLMAAFALMSFPSSYYIGSNCVVVPFFVSFAGILVVLISGMIIVLPVLASKIY